MCQSRGRQWAVRGAHRGAGGAVGALVLWSFVGPSAAAGQLNALPRRPTDSATIAAIEAEGATFPRDSVVPPFPRYSWTEEMARDIGPAPSIYGGPERECVYAPTEPVAGGLVRIPPVRSGEFVVSGYPAPVQGQRSKLVWTAMNASMDMTLLLRGRRLGSPADSLRREITDIIAPLHSKTHEPYADEAAFPSGIEFSAAGVWVVVATNGRNWGCFVFTVE